MIDHHKISAYHPHANRAIEYFNKTLIRDLTNICNLDQNDWDDKNPVILLHIERHTRDLQAKHPPG